MSGGDARTGAERRFGSAGRRGSTPRRGAGRSGPVAATKEKVRPPHDRVTLRDETGGGKVGPDSEIRIAPAGIATGSAETRRRWSVQQQGVDRVPVPQGGLPAQQLPGQGDGSPSRPTAVTTRGRIPGERSRSAASAARSKPRIWCAYRPRAVAWTVRWAIDWPRSYAYRSGSPPVWAPTTSAAACRAQPWSASARLTRMRFHVSSSRWPRANRHGCDVPGRRGPAGRLQQGGGLVAGQCGGRVERPRAPAEGEQRGEISHPKRIPYGGFGRLLRPGKCGQDHP